MVEYQCRWRTLMTLDELSADYKTHHMRFTCFEALQHESYDLLQWYQVHFCASQVFCLLVVVNMLDMNVSLLTLVLHHADN